MKYKCVFCGKEQEGYGVGAAMVHSPNCECNKGSERLNDEKNCFD